MRFWILITSVASFLVGWAMLAHAPKPVQPSSVPAAPTLAPLQPLQFGNQNNDDDFNNFFQNSPNIIQRQPSFGPTFRTGGS
jgi:hypothetical protein